MTTAYVPKADDLCFLARETDSVFWAREADGSTVSWWSAAGAHHEPWTDFLGRMSANDAVTLTDVVSAVEVGGPGPVLDMDLRGLDGRVRRLTGRLRAHQSGPRVVLTAALAPPRPVGDAEADAHRRLALRLVDEVAQELSLVSMYASRMGTGRDVATLRAQLMRARDRLRRLAVARRDASDPSESATPADIAADALGEYASLLVGAPLSVSFETDGAIPADPVATESLFVLLREALNGLADRAADGGVAVSIVANRDEIVASVEFSGPAPGLAAAEERIAAIGGRLDATAGAVRLCVPRTS
jgi:hypothetical protein